MISQKQEDDLQQAEQSVAELSTSLIYPHQSSLWQGSQLAWRDCSGET